MGHLQQNLAQTGDPGGEFEMADIAFDRAQSTGLQRQRTVLHLGLAFEIGKGRNQRFDFDRIAERGAGAMRFDITDGARVDPCIPPSLAQQVSLRPGIGRGQRTGAAAVVFRAGADHAKNGVAIAFGIGQALQENQSDALAAHIAIGRRGKRFATTIRRKHPGLVEADEGLW